MDIQTKEHPAKMEIKIRCNCGSSLSFEDTPVEGKLEHPLHCTNCGNDCTAPANEFIRRRLAGEPEPPTDRGIRNWAKLFQRPKPEFDTDAVVLRKGKIPGNIRPAAEVASATGDEAGHNRIALAAGAALAVGLLGAIGWLLVARATGYQIGYIAWALGGLVGWTSRLVAPRGHSLLGLIASLAAFIAIGGGQYLVSRWAIGEAVHEYAPVAYAEILAYAKETSSAQSSEDLRERTAEYKLVQTLAGKDETNAIAAYQTYQIADSGFALLGLVSKDRQPRLTFAEREQLSDVKSITVPEIARFDSEVAPVMKKLVEGQPTQADYEHSLEQRIQAGISVSNVAAFAMNRYTILWLFLGLGSAYRIARNASLQY